jgi:hypothetical protein
MTQFVQIESPEGKIGKCSERALPIWEAKGYKLHVPDVEPVDAPTNDEPVPVVAPTDIEVAQRILDGAADGADLFDPTEHTVSEITKYLATADSVEFARVVEAERAGKGRASVLRLSPSPIVPAQTDDAGAPSGDDAGGTSTEGADSEQQQDELDPAVPGTDES